MAAGADKIGLKRWLSCKDTFYYENILLIKFE